MSEDLGACVVLIPKSDTPIVTTAGRDIPEVEGGRHITLAYFGGELSPEHFKELMEIAADISFEFRGHLVARTKEIQHFGPESDAVVLTLDTGPDEVPDILREELLNQISPELELIFEEAETFPTYRPHITLGYISEGVVEEDTDFLYPEEIEIEAIAVWNGRSRQSYPLTNDALLHYGILRKSGRFPWGSGENPNQRNRMFLDAVNELHKQGLTEKQIAEGFGMTTTALRASKTIAKSEQRRTQQHRAQQLKNKNMSNIAIGRELGINESVVRGLLRDSERDAEDILATVSNKLRDRVNESNAFIDIGEGVEANLGISQTKLNTAVAMLEEEGYVRHRVKVTQVGTGKETIVKVITPPGTTFGDVYKNMDKIENVQAFSDDHGRTFKEVKPPVNLDSKRIEVRYGPDGGADMDGVIQIRRGVDDISLGSKKYAQVRIAVDGTHYLKGMAMYADDLPDGVDVRFNTNKTDSGNKLKAMKALKDDPASPFGAIVDQRYYEDAEGKTKQSVMNIVNEEGDWGNWSKSISSQMLSKQPVSLAKQQLAMKLESKQIEFDGIQKLTNPAIKKKLLESFADDLDSSAVHLKAAALPRQKTQVILPINTLKDDEIYAPNFRDGEKVVLVRYPHGGIFEIPELTVNNRNKEANNVIKQAIDAVGINSRVAGRLSGADFDGDTVLVIPNNKRAVINAPPLDKLKGFDPQKDYAPYDGMKTIDGGVWNGTTKKVDYGNRSPSGRVKQLLMGDVSNLITDMTIQDAPHSEIARAVRHSMVVIDAEKHSLDHKQSKQDNGINELKKKYQGGSTAGAATLISRSSSQERVPERKPRPAKDGGPVDPLTGKKVYVETGESYVNKDGKTVVKSFKSTKMAEVDDARDLLSANGGTPMERAYADHANSLKALANSSRKAALEVKPIPYNKSARVAYNPEVTRLKAALSTAYQNKPRERQAQLIANALVKQKTQANPGMDAAELKKLKSMALITARERTNAKKDLIEFSDREWEAVQSGAISNGMLKNLLDNANLDQVKQLSMPRQDTGLSSAKLARAKAMAASGYTQAEIADQLGVSTSTLNAALK